MASSWSSSENVNDITIDENSLSEDLLRDIELFSEHINRLRISLDSSSYVPDGESKCVQVHAALSMVSQSVRDLLVRYPLFKTSHVLIPTSQLVHSIKEINFADAVLDASKTLACIDKLEGAVGNTLKQSLDVSISMLNITNKNKSEPGNTNRLVGKYSTPTMSSQTPKPSSKIPLIRRHSSFKHKFSYDNNSPLIPGDKLDEFLADQEDGISVAFECNKNQSKHFKDIITYIKKRIDLEHEHASKIMALTKETRTAFKNEKHLPLLEHYMGCFECDLNFCENVYKVYDSINDKVKEFEKKREEQEHFKRSLKNEFSKDIKKLKDCENELIKARNVLVSKEDGYIKAKNSTLRSEKNVISFSYSIDPKRSLKEMDKRKRNEDSALAKVDEAKNYVKKMEGEMCRKIQSVDRAKKATISQLRELIYHCDQSTKACSIYYFQALSELWDSLPGTYQELSDAIRNYTPGTEYMSFLQNLPKRPLSTSSGLRKNLAKCESDEYLLKNNSKNKSLFGGDRLFGDNEISAAVARRRNALNLEDHHAIPLAHTSRRQKKSMSRLFDSNIDDPSEAAKSHKLQRVRQPTKCSYCENISLLSTYQCTNCDTFYHKTCLSRLTAYCSEGRRTSIFGIPLEGSLSIEECKIPFILERCIYEIEIRGMRCKGIYRTCGVKSKIEQICEDFEKLETDKDVKLCDIHPMNVASVIKLYLRKLPEPVMTFSLQKEWINIANAINPTNPDLTKLIECSKKLPLPNYTTLKYLLIHLNRVTWYESENLMNAFNLANVIAPSLMWTKMPSPIIRKKSSNSKDKKIFLDHATLYSDAHNQTKVFEYLIKYAYEVFGVDINEDKKQFFAKFPSNRLDDWDEPTTTTELIDEIDDIDDKDAFGSDGHLEYISSTNISSTSKKSLNNVLSASNFVKESLSQGELLYKDDNNTNVPSSGKVDRYLSQNMMSNIDKEEKNLPSDKYPYTTSILIAPQSDRKVYYSQSDMIAENMSSPATSSSGKIQSGDVTVDHYNKSTFLNHGKIDNHSKNTQLSADIRSSIKGPCSYESDRCSSAKVTSKKFDSQS
ncbi:Rho GTPase-activating protein domain and FCH domain and Protein kinase C-like, phorbol ester/diacylglycerol binding domain and Rho GTPase activation protein domain-containing protein [Strongyloides ratti]|uniref:Rho GTPase-activating protein domain and FCH domain and Protein kinase C-like, phorbol ester/diacylglycerol binding domain and Rho GTPase activation protein domain-containing protein n=1 Tax=Strongyloides ratti TaxID=34506 RepID=A0A090LUD2_STRRB|nr:Rho GTPase-activating protein domain and FCH domain and Protein kinase C-like, phorbol ester/diacylglycerol binding domain and Rho GTPase activation protein domain-containing protein [Strongyloides ratti]CEF71204.1 Rho GTPase-activating protein domain and FCH domain and Protein kinase C-like, phorbol ester/diacylglycerol binding domain and Rho GTPase activation protein domain-containing protein [Strongyloides ratti]